MINRPQRRAPSHQLEEISARSPICPERIGISRGRFADQERHTQTDSGRLDPTERRSESRVVGHFTAGIMCATLVTGTEHRT